MVVIAAPTCFPILANRQPFRPRRIDPAGDQRGGSPTATRTCTTRFAKLVVFGYPCRWSESRWALPI